MDRTVPFDKDPLWYKRGVIYEVHVRAFSDSDQDGSGDFAGLTSRLDHLRDLGITTLWLLPFYPSPLKDDGYDISDYRGVHPMYGTLADFKDFLREAHRRRLRVITELVLNHTSNQHPWFQRARRSPPGSHWREYYVWSDTPEKYKDARIIFKDTEISNWSWDPVGRAYYWHRFYSHQPDLNYDHPPVHRQMIRALDFWLDMGVDGVRLDAVPYLYERDGTSCENLPETHAFLRELREHVDKKYGDRMLLGEANQWPEDAVTYFGKGAGDECHMAFHFPLMPRLFMAVRLEDRTPIVDILDQTPAIPETAQWALFLRNHDELTLEMVTDEERDYMYRLYAHVHQARLNLGIRRRLAPLLGNDRKRIELLNALLFSLPGTPVLYYGDEIGMGDNIYLGDRNGVRTPMQWSADKNGGFSRANPQSLYLPINLDPENHYEAVNVDLQRQNPASLLWWMKGLIALRARWKAFGHGTIEFLHPANRKVFVFIRRYDTECILVVVNLSRFVQPVEIDLSAWQGRVPIELFGRTEFPPIKDKVYFLALGPYAFYWFSLEQKAPASAELSDSGNRTAAIPSIELNERWEEIIEARRRSELEAALQQWLPTRRWFTATDATITNVQIAEHIVISMGSEKAFLLWARVEYLQRDPETYLIPITYISTPDAGAADLSSVGIPAAQIKISSDGQKGALYDAIANKQFCMALLKAIAGRRRFRGTVGEMEGERTDAFRDWRAERHAGLNPELVAGEQSNSSVVFGERFILKLFRRLDPGVNPDLEIGRFLLDRSFPYAPALAGSIEFRGAADEPMTVAVLHEFVPKAENGWDYTIEALGRFFERAQALVSQGQEAPTATGSLVSRALAPVPQEVTETIGTYLESARKLGDRAGEMHLALASEAENPNFVPEIFTPHYQRGLFQSLRNLVRQTSQLLGSKSKTMPEDLQRRAQEAIRLEPEILRRCRGIFEKRLELTLIRLHGDFRLGQIIHTGKDFYIIDFEGEASIPMGERRIKKMPLIDVAGMICSFYYAAHTALRLQVEHGPLPGSYAGQASGWVRYWVRWVSSVFLGSYLQRVNAASFLPKRTEDLEMLLEIFLLRKTSYELGVALRQRPARVSLALQAVLDRVGDEIASAASTPPKPPAAQP